MNNVNSGRIKSALWFAVTGFVPAVAAFITFSEFSLLSYVLYLALPVILAGVSGYIIGYPIVQEEKIRTGKQAAARGLLVSVVSYLILGLGFIIIIGITALADPTGLPLEFKDWLTMGFVIIAGLLLFFPIFFFGQFALLLVSGGFAGWLLFANKDNIKKLILIGSAVILPMGTYLLWSLPNPNDLPIYPKADSVKYGEFHGGVDSGTAEEKTITFQTNDSFEKVLDYYDQQLVKEGWRLSYRLDNALEVYSPTKNYRVRIEKNSDSQPEQIEVTLWHSTLFSFP